VVELDVGLVVVELDARRGGAQRRRPVGGARGRGVELEAAGGQSSRPTASEVTARRRCRGVRGEGRHCWVSARRGAAASCERRGAAGTCERRGN
jgi:ribosomal protein L15E